MRTYEEKTLSDRIIDRLILWREKYLSERQFIILLSLFVGVASALAGLLMKFLIHQIEKLLTDHFDQLGFNWLYLVYPVVGIWLTSLFIRYIVKDDIGHGVTKILYAISRKQSKIKSHNCWTSVVASSITIGFGGSVGGEAPIVLTGSAIGSHLGQLFKIDHRNLMVLVGCGAAGAIAGIFKAPIAGVVFTLEVLMLDLTMHSLLPLLVSCVTATCVTYVFSGTNAMFDFNLINPFVIDRVPSSILLGICCGFLSLYFTRAMNWFENVFAKLKTPYRKLALGGSVVSILIFLFPSLYGEGYSLISILLTGQNASDWGMVMDRSMFSGMDSLLLVYLGLILLFKVFATTATNGGGGCGGTFAPSLFLGCIMGFIFARLWNTSNLDLVNVPETNYSLLGMAGVMSGVMHAPLTGMFLIAELTGGYDLFVPLMIVSVSSYLTIIAFEPHSIYSMRLAKKGELLTHNKDAAIMTLMSMDDLIEKDFLTVTPDMNLGELVSTIAKARRNIFPVVDGAGHLKGIIQMDDIRNIIFRQELYGRYSCQQLMVNPPCIINIMESMSAVMRKFDETNAWNLPVESKDGKFLGFISKSRVYSTYRQVLVDFSQE
ncbi:MAG: chloride channel protein [Bacteroidaceae bacterium]|jgi:CIC family chloride channel protein|nr:chloride channel protein [Bacteroidaceae bacterium]